MFVVLAVALVATTLPAQTPPRRMPRPPVGVSSAEMAVKQAAERLADERRVMERDVRVLGLIRGADRALVDPMQPSIAVEKSFDFIGEAERLNGDPYVRQGLIRARQELEAARRSPGSADFGRLRAVIDTALGMSSRLVVRNATRLQEETIAWIAVQELIATHLKTLSDITGDCLRASDLE